MKKLFLSILISACLHVSAQSSEPFSTWNFGANAASSIKEVEVNTVNGNITVTGSNGPETTVEMYVSDNNRGIRRQKREAMSNEEIKQELERNFTIEVKVDGEQLLVVARPNSNSGPQRLSISFKITTPQPINSSLRAVNGGISINNLLGSHNIQTVNGSLKADSISGNVFGSTTNGSINVTNSKGKITLTTVNGSVNISDVTGVISTSTVNGRVKETNVTRE